MQMTSCDTIVCNWSVRSLLINLELVNQEDIFQRKFTVCRLIWPERNSKYQKLADYLEKACEGGFLRLETLKMGVTSVTDTV